MAYLLAGLAVLVGTGVIYDAPPSLAPQLVTPKVIAANRAGLLKLCFRIRAVREEPDQLEAIVRKRVGDFGDVEQTARRAGVNRYVLQQDGSYIDFYTVGAHYNTTAVRLCADLLDSERKGGSLADQIPQPDVM